MKAVFIELPAFTRYRNEYLTDEELHIMQTGLMTNPKQGDVIEGTGGLRKLRFGDSRRGKGKRGGLRVIYYWQVAANHFLLFTVYDKDEANDLTAREKAILKEILTRELGVQQ
ncbi:MAG: hypothetical protein ACYC3A_11915 [Halothiobacillus sp.]